MLGEASTPQTLRPSATSASEIGAPCPQPRSSTSPPGGMALAHWRTVAAPILDLVRPEMNSLEMPSYPFDLSLVSASPAPLLNSMATGIHISVGLPTHSPEKP